MNLPEELHRVLETLRDRGARPLVVGGAVRDHVRGGDPEDFDVEVYGLPSDRVFRTLETLGPVQAVGRAFGVFKVTIGGLEFDVSLPRRERKTAVGHRGFDVDPDPFMPPEEAAVRRDFTMNALAFDPQQGEILDFFGGVDDARRGVLRHTSSAFAEDPLRVLRGVQFAGRFDLRAAPETIELSRSLLDEYAALPLERVWVEWWKWAAKSVRPSAGLRFLAQTGWRDLYPELDALEGCPQEPEWHPEGDVWIHTLHVCDAAAQVADRDRLPPEPRGVLLLAALCHDLGKPETTESVDGRIRSRGHQSTLETFERYLARIHTPAAIMRRVIGLSEHHLAHLNFTGSSRHVRRLSRSLGDAGETIESLARLVEADHSGRPPLSGGLPAEMRRMVEVAGELQALRDAPVRILLGRHLLAMGVSPGPDMGRVLDAAFEAQLNGEFDTLADAERWARGFLE